MSQMHPVLAAEHIRDLRAAADRFRLAALARCCRPGTWRVAGGRARSAIRTWFRAGQLGPVRNCCAGP